MKCLLLVIILSLPVLAGIPMFLGAEPTTPPKEAPPRTPETGIDPGIRVDPGPSPDPRASVPPKINPDPGMAINPDVTPGARPKVGSSEPGQKPDQDKQPGEERNR